MRYGRRTQSAVTETASSPSLGESVGMVASSAAPRAEDYLAATEAAFSRCPKLSGLRFVSADIDDGFLAVRFEGPADDFRGPYGVVVRLPGDRQDEQWARYSGTGTVDDWAHRAVAMRSLSAHEASADQHRGYSPDGVWWLVSDPAVQDVDRQEAR